MKNKKGGFIQIILLVVGALVFLKYIYNIDVVGFLTSGKSREWLDKLYNIATLGWGKYGEILTRIWNYGLAFVKNIF